MSVWILVLNGVNQAKAERARAVIEGPMLGEEWINDRGDWA